MSRHFAVHFLASGSSGNCTLIDNGAEESIAIDLGLGPQRLVEVLAERGIALRYWRARRDAKPAAVPAAFARRLSAVMLTHLHGDHLCPNSLRLLLDNDVHLWVHESHLAELEKLGALRSMLKKELVSVYSDKLFQASAQVRVLPLQLEHDATATHGFVVRCRAGAGAVGSEYKFSYFADLGCINSRLIEHAADSDLLGLEFNHDVDMELNSGRHPWHIKRVLGRQGHLSNEQAADALERILRSSQRKKLQGLALLHISRQCNTHQLASRAASRVLSAQAPQARLLVTRHRQYAGTIELVPQSPRHVTEDLFGFGQ